MCIRDRVAAVQRAVRDVTNASEKILLYKGNTEYYVTLSKILFFETDENGISAVSYTHLVWIPWDVLWDRR